MLAHEVVFAARTAVERLGVSSRLLRVEALEKVGCSCGECWRFAASTPPPDPGPLRCIELRVRGNGAVEIVKDTDLGS